MRINVETLARQKDFKLELDPFYTDLDIKKQIEFIHDIPWRKQHLLYESAYIGDNDTLIDYDVQDGDTIHLVREGQKSSMTVIIETLTGRRFPIQVEPWFTLKDVQYMIQAEDRIPLVYNALSYW